MRHTLRLSVVVTRLALSFLLVVVCVLGLSNCGGGSGDTVIANPPSAPPPPPPSPPPAVTFLYASNTDANNISGYRLDRATGALTAIAGSPFPAVDGPTSIVMSPTSTHLVAGISSGSKLLTYRFETTTGALTQVASLPFGSGAPFHLVFTRENRFLYSSDVFSGNISAFSINASTGALTPVAGSPFPGSLTQVTALALEPAFGSVLYAVGTGIAAYTVNQTTGALTEMPGSPFHVGLLSSSRNSVAVDVASRFLYATDSGANVVRVFSLAGSGAVQGEIAGSPFTAGTAPAWFAFNRQENFAFVANRDSGDVTAFSVNINTGALQSVGTVIAGTEPFSLIVAERSGFVYVANRVSGNISGYAINSTTGMLTPVPGSSFSAGNGTIFLAMTGEP